MSGHPTWTQDNVVSLALVGSCRGQAIVNVLHFQQVSGTQDPAGAAAFCDTLAADFETNLKAAYVACHPTDYALTTIRATPVAVSGLAHVSLASHDRPVTVANTGADATSGDMTAAAEIKLRTAEGGKSHRGRIYLGPLIQAASTGGALSHAGLVAHLFAFAAAVDRYLAAGAFAATGILVVFSKPLHAGQQQWAVRTGGSLVVRSNAAARPGDATPVTALIVDGLVRSQRRREIGVGA